MTLHALTRYLAAAVWILGFSAAYGQYPEQPIEFVIPFAAGSFIYVATADLIPELKKDIAPLKSFLQLIAIIFGIGIMHALKIFSF